jgi:MFS family permease
MFYQSLDFSGAQIGLLTGLSPLLMLVAAPLWTGLADSRRLHRQVMSLSLAGSALLLLLLPGLRAFWPILAVMFLIQVCYAPLTALADSATMHMLGERRDLYGRIRLGGTIGFGLASTAAGWLVQLHGLRATFWFGALMVVLALLLSQKLVHAPAAQAANDPASLRKLVANPRWLIFLGVAFAGGLGTAATNSYLFPFLKELHAPESVMGYAMTIGTLSEVPILLLGSRLVKRFSPYRLFMFGVIFTGARLACFALAQSATLILFLQLFGGLTFVVMWLGGVAYAHQNAPPGYAASAQGMLNAMVFGIGAAVGGFSGGLLLDALGGRGMYLVFGLVILGIAGLAALLRSRLPPAA